MFTVNNKNNRATSFFQMALLLTLKLVSFLISASILSFENEIL